MALIPWEPLRDVEKFFDEDWDFMPLIPFKGANLPPVDVSRDKKNVYVEMPLAGFKPEDVEISVEENVLTVKGKTKEKKEEKKKNYSRQEIRKGAFEKSVVLPSDVKENKAVAEFKDGMLNIVLPKAAAKKTKKVEVKVKK